MLIGCLPDSDHAVLGKLAACLCNKRFDSDKDAGGQTATTILPKHSRNNRNEVPGKEGTVVLHSNDQNNLPDDRANNGFRKIGTVGELGSDDGVRFGTYLLES